MSGVGLQQGKFVGECLYLTPSHASREMKGMCRTVSVSIAQTQLCTAFLPKAHKHSTLFYSDEDIGRGHTLQCGLILCKTEPVYILNTVFIVVVIIISCCFNK